MADVFSKEKGIRFFMGKNLKYPEVSSPALPAGRYSTEKL